MKLLEFADSHHPRLHAADWIKGFYLILEIDPANEKTAGGRRCVAFWIFKSNPILFKLDERLQDPEPHTSWTVSRYRNEIQIGDLAFIWRTGPERGIVAVVEIISKPEEMYELDHEQKYWKIADTDLIFRVIGNFKYRFPCISHKQLKQIDELKNLSVFHGSQRQIIFPVTATEGNILIDLIEAKLKSV